MALEIQSLTLEQETIDSKAKPVTMISTLSSYSLALQQQYIYRQTIRKCEHIRIRLIIPYTIIGMNNNMNSMVNECSYCTDDYLGKLNMLAQNIAL